MLQIAQMNPTAFKPDDMSIAPANDGGSNFLLKGFDQQHAFAQESGNHFADYLAKLSPSQSAALGNSSYDSRGIYDPQNYRNDMQTMIAKAAPDSAASVNNSADGDVRGKEEAVKLAEAAQAEAARVEAARAADEKAAAKREAAAEKAAADEKAARAAAEKAAGEDALYAEIKEYMQADNAQSGGESADDQKAAASENGIAIDGDLKQNSSLQVNGEAVKEAAKKGSQVSGEPSAKTEAGKKGEGIQASVRQDTKGTPLDSGHSAGGVQKNTGEIKDGVFYDKHSPAEGEAANERKIAVKVEGAVNEGSTQKLKPKNGGGVLDWGEAAKQAGEKLKGSGDAKKSSSSLDGDSLSSAKKARKKGDAEMRGSVHTETASLNPAQEKEITKVTSANGKETEITVHLRSEPKNFSSAAMQDGGKSAQTLENSLARELHQNLNSNIVRQASVILGEGGTGTVKLSLKPESLGQVKIHLLMADNKVTGNIVVESEEALRAFRQELASLEAAFKEGGFDGAALNLQLANGEARGRGEEAKEMRDRAAIAAGASLYDSNSVTLTEGIGSALYSEHARSSLNVLV